MTTKNSSPFNPLVIIAWLILTGTMSGCMEISSAEYENTNDAVAKNAIGKSKWLPTWLPKDAVDIQEAHDVDTNESWLVFHPTSGRLELPKSCSPIVKPEMTDERTMRRFPKFSREAWSRASDFTGDFYLCAEINSERWVMYDEDLRLVYSRAKF